MGGFSVEYGSGKRMIVTTREINWSAERDMLDLTQVDARTIDDLTSEGAFQKTIAAI